MEVDTRFTVESIRGQSSVQGTLSISTSVGERVVVQGYGFGLLVMLSGTESPPFKDLQHIWYTLGGKHGGAGK